MWFYHLKLALRSLQKNRFYAFLNIAGFAAGFAVMWIVALFIYLEKTVDRNFKDSGRIYRLISSEDCHHDFKIAAELHDAYPEIELAAPVQYISNWSVNLSSENNFVKVDEIISTNNRFFELFQLELVEGISQQPFAEMNAAVITQSLASKLFGGQNPLGKQIDIGGFFKARISGVIQDFPANTSLPSELFLNIDDEAFKIRTACDNNICRHPADIYVKLFPFGDKTALEKKIQMSLGQAVWLQPLTNIYFDKEIKNNSNRNANAAIIYIFASIAALILILSIFNHVNFAVAMQFSKLRTTGVKKTNGAGIRQLVAYHIVENSLIIVAAFAFAIGLAILILPLASRFFDQELQIRHLLLYPLNLFVITVTTGAVVATAIIPMNMISRFDVRKFFNGKIAEAKTGGISQGISIFQIAASIVLLASVLVIHKQLSYAKHIDLGFEKENLIKINLPGDFIKGELAKNELGRLHFVRSSTLSLGAPGSINLKMGVGHDSARFMASCIEVDGDFIDVFELQLIEGRNFRSSEEDKTCIVNEEAMRKFGWENIHGKVFDNAGGLEVVGLVKNFHIGSLHQPIEPVALIFSKNSNKFKNTLSLKLAPGRLDEQINLLKKSWQKVAPGRSFDFAFYDAFFNALYQKEERLAQAMGIFSILAFLITLMGISGMAFQACLNKTKEIGIRKVNGAKVWEVMALLNRDFAKGTIIAFFFAMPVAWIAMNKWLQNFAYKTGLSWWIFVLAGAITLAIALLTVSWQSWKAATRNPVEALRYE